MKKNFFIVGTVLFHILLLILFFRARAEAQSVSETATLVVEIREVEHNRGNIHVGLYNNGDDFLNVENVYQGVIESAESGNMYIVLGDIPVGRYAIAIFHDENSNGTLDRNMFRLPTEGIGISNNIRTRFGPPSYRDAAFRIENNRTIRINMNY